MMGVQMMRFRSSRRTTVAVLTLSGLLLSGCASSKNHEDSGLKADPLSTAYESSFDVNKDFEQAVLSTVKASGIAESQWRYAGGKQFSSDYFHQRVPQMSTYCGKKEDGTELYNKDLRLEAEHRFTHEQYVKKSDEMWSHWESAGYKPYVVGSDSSSKKIAYKTEGGALIQFDAGEGGLMVFADSACVLPGVPDPLAS